MDLYMDQGGNGNANYHNTPNTLDDIRILNETCSANLFTRKIVNLDSFIFRS